MQNYINAYTSVLKKYTLFTGRARRSEYWMFVLVSFVISLVLGMIDGALHIKLLGFIYAVAVLLPSLAVGVRRLHDTGRSGWWMLLVFIPFIGAIILIVWMATDSQPGDNAYGPNPKGTNVPAAPATPITPTTVV